MAYVMLRYDRPTDTQHWNEYNQRVRDWIAQSLRIPGAISLMAYRTVDGASPDTITMLEFDSLGSARQAVTSDTMALILQDLRSVGASAKVQIVERSPLTPEPIRA
jgi:uncharacterized protein (DUF1330 family)